VSYEELDEAAVKLVKEIRQHDKYSDTLSDLLEHLITIMAEMNTDFGKWLDMKRQKGEL
jgi:hypothetical protein